MRSRNIKPSFFTNEDLVSMPPLYRLLFQGLWCMADRRGLLGDRPLKIKMEVLPVDDIDIDVALEALMLAGLIVRYTGSNGAKTIKVLNFKRHQKPDQREKINPALVEPDDYAASRGNSTTEHDSYTDQSALNVDSGMRKEEGGMTAAAPPPESPPVVAADQPETKRPQLATHRQQQFAARLLKPAGLTVAGWLEGKGYDELLDTHIDEIRATHSGRQPAPSTGPRGHELPEQPDPDLTPEERAAAADALQRVKAAGRVSPWAGRAAN